MNSDDVDGLPLPEAPYKFPRRPGPKPVPAGTACTPVRVLIQTAMQVGQEPTERWNREVPAAARSAGTKVPRSPVPQGRIDRPRADAVPGYFKGEDRAIDHLGDGGWGTLGAVASFFVHPVGTAVHDIYSARINAWQKAFRHDHGPELQSMNRAMSIVEDQCEAMRTVVHAVPTMDPRIRDIIKEKEELGDRLLKDVEDCLRKSKPGPDREKLEALWKEIREWMADRDARVEADRREVLQLERAIEALGKEAKELDLDLRASATEARLMRLTSGEGTLIHASPEAVIFAAKLRAYLMATRQRIDDALLGA